MLTEMLSNLRDESLYTENFKEFVDLEEIVKRGESISNLLKTWNERKRKKSKKIVKDVTDSNEIYRSVDAYFGIQGDRNYKMVKLGFTEHFREKIKTRQNIIRCLLQHYQRDNNMYYDLLEEFINLEEDFVEQT